MLLTVVKEDLTRDIDKHEATENNNNDDYDPINDTMNVLHAVNVNQDSHGITVSEDKP